jgi:hypothetical protein
MKKVRSITSFPKTPCLQPSVTRNFTLTLPHIEQESVIRTLHQENTTRNLQYSRILLALPLLSLIPYLPTLFTPHTTLLSLLSISSLLSTAYLLFTLPPGITSISILDSFNVPPGTETQPNHMIRQIQDDGPIAQYLPYLNLGLCAVLGLLGVVVSGGLKGEVLWWGFGWLPAGVYAVVLFAKYVMGSVDPEGELGRLRYGFKGA